MTKKKKFADSFEVTKDKKIKIKKKELEEIKGGKNKEKKWIWFEEWEPERI